MSGSTATFAAGDGDPASAANPLDVDAAAVKDDQLIVFPVPDKKSVRSRQAAIMAAA